MESDEFDIEEDRIARTLTESHGSLLKFELIVSSGARDMFHQGKMFRDISCGS